MNNLPSVCVSYVTWPGSKRNTISPPGQAQVGGLSVAGGWGSGGGRKRGSWVHPILPSWEPFWMGKDASVLQMGFWGGYSASQREQETEQASASGGKAQALSRTPWASTYPSDFLKRGARCTRYGKTAVGTVRENRGGGVGQECKNLSLEGISDLWGLHRGKAGFQQTWRGKGIDCLPIYWAISDIYRRWSVMIWFMYILKLSSQQVEWMSMVLLGGIFAVRTTGAKWKHQENVDAAWGLGGWWVTIESETERQVYALGWGWGHPHWD